MVKWKDIHPDFTPELQKKWEELDFDYNEAEKWINILGISPNEYEFAVFAKKLDYDVESILNIGVDNLQAIYQENLQAQRIFDYEQENEIDSALKQRTAQQRTEFLSQLEEAAGEDEEDNGGLLTNDNLAFILENDQEIKEARERNQDKIQVITDIANIHSYLERARKGEVIEETFWNSLENSNQKYTILPLRVNDKHRELLIIANNPYHHGKVSGINYLSLSSFHQHESEDEIRSFLDQLEARSRIESIVKNDLSEVISVPPNEDNKLNDTCDCGVFCCLITRFLCFDNFVNLDVEDYIINSEHIRGFRKMWKKKMGEENWCKWDEQSVAWAKVQTGETEVLESFEKGEAIETKENLLSAIKKLEKRLEKSETEKKSWQEKLLVLSQEWMKEIQQEIDKELVIELWKKQEELRENNNTETWKELKNQEEKIKEKIGAEKWRRFCQLKGEIAELEEQKKQFEAKIEFNQEK